MSNELQEQLTKQGFNCGRSGAHSARSMMLQELTALFEATEKNASFEDYEQAVVTRNVLQKATENSRKLTLRHMKALYGLSPDILLFRVFRQWWELSEQQQPLLALQLAMARDPLLRSSVDTILQLHEGELLDRDQIENNLSRDDPDRFSEASLTSFTQNINASWTQAGFLKGRSKKIRTEPTVGFVNLAYALFLTSCHHISGAEMFKSEYCKLLAQDKETLYQLAHTASVRGLLVFKHASEVIVVNFPEHTTK